MNLPTSFAMILSEMPTVVQALNQAAFGTARTFAECGAIFTTRLDSEEGEGFIVLDIDFAGSNGVEVSAEIVFERYEATETITVSADGATIDRLLDRFESGEKGTVTTRQILKDVMDLVPTAFAAIGDTPIEGCDLTSGRPAQITFDLRQVPAFGGPAPLAVAADLKAA